MNVYKMISDLMEKNEKLKNQAKFDELRTLIVRWSMDRQIIQNSTVSAQTLKAVSEMGELADAVAKDDTAGMVDAIGDVLVCLINVCEIRKLDIVDCLESAYEEIKFRKGTLHANGVFIKE